MINIKTNKGITIITLVITVIILLILSGTIIYNTSTYNGTGNYNYMVSDIKILKDKSLIYFNQYGQIPTTDRAITIDGQEYKELDLNKLGSLTLNYGHEFGEKEELTNTSDVYVIDDTLNIYYIDGVEMDGAIYHEY